MKIEDYNEKGTIKAQIEALHIDESAVIGKTVSMKEFLEIADRCLELRMRNEWLENKFREWYHPMLDERLEAHEKILQEILLILTKKRNLEYLKGNQRHISRSLRQEILVRDKFTCKNCGIKRNDFFAEDNRECVLHIDHIIPISKGGKSYPDNLQVLCSTCNLIKANHLFNERNMEKKDGK